MKIPKARQMSSGNWFIQLRLNGQSISVVANSEKKCIAKATNIKAGVTDTRALNNETTLSTAIDKYISCRNNILSPATIRGYRIIQKNRFKALMERRIDSLNQEVLQKACNLESKLCGAKTLTNAWRFISSVICEEIGQRYSVRLPQIVQKDISFLEPQQIKPFIKALEGTEIEIFALLGLHGLRKSEILGLRWKDIDLQKRLIYVNGAITIDENNKYFRKETTKNQSSKRVVPIMIENLYIALVKAKENNSEINTYNPGSYYKAINNFCEKNNFPKIGAHGLRHSFASLAYHVKMPEKVVMQIGGWNNDQTMRKIYTHVAKADVNSYVETMTSFLNDYGSSS